MVCAARAQQPTRCSAQGCDNGSMRLALIPWIWDWTAATWSAAATVATFAVAAIAALFAGYQVLEARRSREASAQPFVVVGFEPSEAWSGIMNIVVENTGTHLANNVHIQFTPPLQSTLKAGQSLSKSRLVTHGLPCLPPRKRMVLLFERMPDLYESAELPRVYEVRVTFEDQWKKEYALKYVLDLDVYFDLSVVEIYGVHHAAQALRGIEQKLERWSRYGDGLGVWVRDDDARMAELAAEVRAAIERSDGLTGSLHLDESEDESANPSEGGPSPTDAQGH